MVTPQTEVPAIAKELKLKALYLKREDLHPYGSHKGRSIPYMIDKKAQDGALDFAISSSGNAALAALRHIQKKNKEGFSLRLTIFIGEKIHPDKKALLFSEVHDDRIKIETSPRPLQALFQAVTGRKAESLRQSTDPLALIGYESLAAEIAPTPELSDVFIGTSSGTTAEALAKYFPEHKKEIAVHVVQTNAVSSIAEGFTKKETSEELSLADAIVDRVAHRKDSVLEALRKTNGTGWIVSNKDIERAIRLLKEKETIDATGNGALALAGLLRAIDQGKTFRGSVVCVITGK